MNRNQTAGLALAGTLGALLLAVHPLPVFADNTDPLAAKCELGITLALAGETASAESVFVSALSEAPEDPRPYVGLGNVHFLRGDLDVALVFYDMAVGKDSTDAGIRLNRATTLMVKGDDAAAQTEAALAVEMAGGEAEAAALVGIKGSGGPTEKASDKTYVSKQEVRDLLSGAMMAPPKNAAAAADSVGNADAAGENRAVKKRSKLWGSSAPRAADDTEAAAVLYWKY